MESTGFSIGVRGPPVVRAETPRRVRRPPIKVKVKFYEEPVKPANRKMLKSPDDWVLGHLLNEISGKHRYIPAMRELVREGKLQNTKLPDKRVLMVPPGTENKFLTNAMDHMKENYRLVGIFRKLLYYWMERKFKVSNEEDLLTGEAPKHLVTLRVNSERSIYQFEATTLMRDMVERLLSHSYLFPKLLMPRNPFTNCELTQVQFFSVMTQLRKAGYTHWLLEGLASCRYELDEFKERFVSAIKKHIILAEFKKPGADTLDLIQTFIEDQHNKNFELFNRSLYSWALTHQISHIRMRTWINLCKDYYLMIYTDGSGKEYRTESARIDTLAKQMCEYESPDLLALYKKSPEGQDAGVRVVNVEEHADRSISRYVSFVNASSIRISVFNFYQSLDLEDDEPSLAGFWGDDSLDWAESP